MALKDLPRHIITDIIERALCSDDPDLNKILDLRLVSHQFNTEIVDAVYNRNVVNIHGKVSWPTYEQKRPTGISLQRVVRGFIQRSKKSTDVLILHEIWRALRDGGLILTVLSKSVSEEQSQESIPPVCTNPTHVPADVNPEHAEPTTTYEVTELNDEDEEPFTDQVLDLLSNAYVDLLGEERAFNSLDISFSRNPANFEVLNGKTGLFWAFVAAARDGRLDLIQKAITMIRSDSFKNGEGDLKMKTCLAAALLVAAKQGHLDAAKLLVAQPLGRVNLRLQNIRFNGKNAMEEAIESNQSAVISLLLEQGWNFTTVPTDYIRGLRAVFGGLQDGTLRNTLLHTLLEGDCQQWRSESITSGLYQELFKRGDLKTCRKVMKLLEEPKQGQFQWQWCFNDNRPNDNIITDPTVNNNNINNEDDDSVSEDDPFHAAEFSPFVPLEERTALYKAVSNKQHHMIPFIFDNESKFPNSMSLNFSLSTRLCCLEHAIKTHNQTTFITLLPYIHPDLDPARLFLYATVKGNIEAMSTLLDRVSLDKVINEKSQFWSFTDHNSDLHQATDNLNDHLNPNNFLFTTYSLPSRNVKLGTFSLLCAIKSLQVPAAQFLLEHNCTIGVRLFIFSPSLISTRRARLFLPHDLANCTQPKCHCHFFNDNLGKWMIMGSLHRFNAVDTKRMVEAGGWIPTGRTRCWTRARRWFLLWRWRPWALNDVDARVITAIQVPMSVFLGERAEEEEEGERKLKAMRKLMKKYKMPDVYIYDT